MVDANQYSRFTFVRTNLFYRYKAHLVVLINVKLHGQFCCVTVQGRISWFRFDNVNEIIMYCYIILFQELCMQTIFVTIELNNRSLFILRPEDY